MKEKITLVFGLLTFTVLILYKCTGVFDNEQNSDSTKISKSFEISDNFTLRKRASDGRSNVHDNYNKKYLLSNWYNIEYYGSGNRGYMLIIFPEYQIRINSTEIFNLNDRYLKNLTDQEDEKIQFWDDASELIKEGLGS